MSITMSFIKIIKHSGTRIAPWGTPALMKPQSDDINKPHHPDIFMNDTPIAEIPNHKHLGLNISKDGTHHTHIDLITEKAYRR
jgi:hypothetical protein